jgi:hypothetical protein
VKASLLAVVAALAACVAVAGTVAATTGSRSDGTARSTVAAHRHFVQTPGGLVEVGPRACDDPTARAAFSRFHAKVHVRAAGPRRLGGDVITRNCD